MQKKMFSLQAMPAKAAHLCLQVQRFLTAHGPDLQGCHLILGCSGGSDSTALLCILHALAPRLHCTLSIAHLNHGLRPESDTEESELAALCQAHSLPFYSTRRDIAHMAACAQSGLEEAGRLARYTFYEEIRQQCTAQWIATGHQLDDLGEDVLMRLLRGAGWPALAGMPAYDPQRHIIRPILHCTKEELQDFLRALTIRWHEDASNADTRFLRNRIRHNIMPLLHAENPSLHEQIRTLWLLGQIDHDFWNSQIRSLATQSVLRHADQPEALATIQHGLLAPLHQAERLRLYRNFAQTLGAHDICARALLALDAAWIAGTGGKTILFSGLHAQIKQGAILFYKSPQPMGCGT